MTIWRRRITCWIPKATNTHSEYVILFAFPLQQWLNERASMYITCTLPFIYSFQTRRVFLGHITGMLLYLQIVCLGSLYSKCLYITEIALGSATILIG